MTAETATPLVANRYRLEAVLGSGAVGRVWRGEDTVLRRPVAVKEVPVPTHLMDDERDALRARVMREAQAAARIHHPGSVQVFDVVDETDRVYLVMELVDELTLAEVVATQGPLTPEATAAIGVELLGALEAAHRVGIVHRDVKPRNVMVLPTGGVKLADFGIASLRDDPRLTKTGMVLGTPSYMAPEQALGEEAGPASDLWSTGALLYFAVEGEPPFDRGEPIATLHAVVTGERRPATRAGALAPVIDRLLVKEPGERFSLSEARDRLQAVAAGGHGDNERTVALAAAAARAAAEPVSTAPAEAVPVPVPMPTDATEVTPAAAVAAPVTEVAPAPVTEVAAAPPLPARVEPPERPAASARPVPGPPVAPVSSGRRHAGRQRSTVAAVVAIVALLALGALLATRMAGGDGDTDTDATGTTTTTPAPATSTPAGATDDDGPGTTAAPSTTAATTTTTEATPATTAPPTTSPPTTAAPAAAGSRPAGVPADWVPYTSPSRGWSIWRPPGWEVAGGGGNAVDLRDPATGDYLRVDVVAQAGDDAVAAWEASSDRFASRYPDYRELRIEPTTYQGNPAALWEYTYRGQHATNLGIVTPGPGYALNFQTAESRWAASQGIRQAFEAGFTIPD